MKLMYLIFVVVFIIGYSVSGEEDMLSIGNVINVFGFGMLNGRDPSEQRPNLSAYPMSKQLKCLTKCLSKQGHV